MRRYSMLSLHHQQFLCSKTFTAAAAATIAVAAAAASIASEIRK
jgi:hypothetical protein